METKPRYRLDLKMFLGDKTYDLKTEEVNEDLSIERNMESCLDALRAGLFSGAANVQIPLTNGSWLIMGGQELAKTHIVAQAIDLNVF